jgi:predicted RNA-binding protein YlxR (DUF448 family)
MINREYRACKILKNITLHYLPGKLKEGRSKFLASDFLETKKLQQKNLIFQSLQHMTYEDDTADLLINYCS